ncbi:hypothetical protein NRB_09760 [Novosphingobium sp. 11B]
MGNSSALRARRLVSQRKVLCAAPQYLFTRGEPGSLGDFANHDLLAYWRSGHSLAWQVPDATGALIDMAVTSRLRFDDLEVIANAAVDGMGLAWLPYWLIRDRIRQGELVELWSERPRVSMECHAVWPATRYLPLRSRLAIDVLAAELPSSLEG